MSRILVLGASGATGGHVVRLAREAGHDVVAAARDPQEHDFDVETAAVDVLEPSGLDEALAGLDAVISALGVNNDPRTLLNPPPLYSEGHANVLDAMEVHGVRRFVAVSALWSRDNAFGPLWFRLGPVMALTRVYSDMRRMERQVSARPGVDYTIVRAGYLQDDPIESPPPQAHADRPPQGHWLTRREDLARFMVSCVESDDWSRRMPCFVQEDDEKVARRKTPDLI
ncbi:NAD(P)-dependent oxidoreductase [Roseobacter sp. HKCCA0434]|uniref:NAD(P)-dependent oxidoreductase n=1 Tax=Roseobacter sp. HKCCA0434 TaxID=3079297 RepID=UPI002905B862|nr:NAD(P)H-binding protein [Roseobacter sp. HKCCA0434]